MGEPFAQRHLDGLLQPGLADHENKEAADDHEEADDLAAELVEGAVLEGVQERTVPDVELDLAEGDGTDDDHQANGEDAEPETVAARCDQRTQKTKEL